MVRVLLVNNGYPSKSNPQYSTYIRSIYECLSAADCKVELLVLNTNFCGKSAKIFRYIEYYAKLFFCSFSQYDSVYIHNYPHSFLPLALRLPRANQLVIHWHGTDIFPGSKIGTLLARLSYRFIPAHVTHMAPSDYFAGAVSKRLGLNKSAVIVSPSGGVDVHRFVPLSSKVDRSTVALGFASSLTVQKGADFVLRLAQHREQLELIVGRSVEFVCIDYGAEREYFAQEMAKIEGIRLVPPMPKDEMVRFYQSIDLLLLLSTRMAESLALVGLEAMSCGVPVVGTDDFAIRDYVVEGVSGERFTKADYSSFFDSVCRAIESLDSYCPREVVLQRYSRECVVQQYREIFDVEAK